MRIMVSGCLLGENCKYNGGNNKNKKVLEFIEGHEVYSICPEVLGGLSIPRACAEIVNDIVKNVDGETVDEQFRKGVELAMEQVYKQKIDLVILQSRSPTCGVKQVYDGTFSGRLIEGQGLFAKALMEHDIKVLDAEDIR